MEDGVAFHKKWAKEIKDKRKLKIGKSELHFVDPQPEKEITLAYNDRWDIKGHIDCVDVPTIYEWKSGVMSSLEYGAGYQVPLYFLLGELSGLEIEKAVILHYNQYKDQADISIVWNSAPQIEKARNFIDSIAPDVEKNFLEAGLILPIQRGGVI